MFQKTQMKTNVIKNFGLNVALCVENKSRRTVNNAYHIKTYKSNAKRHFAQFAKARELRLTPDCE